MGWFNHQPEKALMFLCVLIWFTLHVSWRHKGINPGANWKEVQGVRQWLHFFCWAGGEVFWIYFPVKKNCFIDFFRGVVHSKYFINLSSSIWLSSVLNAPLIWGNCMKLSGWGVGRVGGVPWENSPWSIVVLARTGLCCWLFGSTFPVVSFDWHLSIFIFICHGLPVELHCQKHSWYFNVLLADATLKLGGSLK